MEANTVQKSTRRMLLDLWRCHFLTNVTNWKYHVKTAFNILQTLNTMAWQPNMRQNISSFSLRLGGQLRPGTSQTESFLKPLNWRKIKTQNMLFLLGHLLLLLIIKPTFICQIIISERSSVTWHASQQIIITVCKNSHYRVEAGSI